ncbi:MAG: hypothetical protein LIO86_09275 [Lachnospiraceae bacterium]|nr:hypothetical protein [Lachnospiraceae bacterium]
MRKTLYISTAVIFAAILIIGTGAAVYAKDSTFAIAGCVYEFEKDSHYEVDEEVPSTASSSENTIGQLKDGNIILLDDGMCEFSRFDTEESDTLYSGLYIAGEDIACEKMNIKCTSDYLTVTVFDSSDSYLAYHKTERFTIGEESDAIAEYAASNDFIYTDYSTYVNLQEGMILMIEDGTGEYSVDEGPVIN